MMNEVKEKSRLEDLFCQFSEEIDLTINEDNLVFIPVLYAKLTVLFKAKIEQHIDRMEKKLCAHRDAFESCAQLYSNFNKPKN